MGASRGPDLGRDTIPTKYFPKVAVHFCQTWINGVTRPMGFLKGPIPQPIYIGNSRPSLVPQDTIPLRRMTYLACQEPIASTPSMVDQDVVWTSPQLLMMTRSYDGP